MTIVEYSVKDRIGYITLNRPDKKNALSPAMVTGLKESFKKAADDAAVNW